MSLHRRWSEWIGGQTDDTFDAFWEEYSSAEERIYRDILQRYPAVPQGILGELAESYGIEPVLYMGFLDGINSSLKEPLPLEKFDEQSEFTLDIDYDVLLFNMHVAAADYLYGLKAWDRVFSAEEQEAIYSRYRRSKTVIREPKIGRNDLCPCGSGKKYKKCCGKDA
jgi:hypothetical protein